MLHRPLALARFLLPIALLAACSGTGSPTAPPTTPGPTSTPLPTEGPGLEHPTGATDIVLRFDEAGGFVPPSYLAGRVPIFTLYGDGTVVFQGSGEPKPVGADGIVRPTPLRVVAMDEAQIQELLEFALIDGGLGVARGEYRNDLVADAPTAVFEVHAGDVDKVVSIYALGMGGQPGDPDAGIKAAFATLAEQLRAFDQGGRLPSVPYVPEAWRGVLIESGPIQGVPTIGWPWTDITPADFAAPGGANDPGLPTRAMTADEIGLLDLPDWESGLQNVYLVGPDGRTFGFTLRPLMPDEAA